MRRKPLLLCLLALPAGSGCQSLADVLIDRSVDSAFQAATGETGRQRNDRRQMDGYRESWAAPGQPAAAAEATARQTFREVNGRDPDLNRLYR